MAAISALASLVVPNDLISAAEIARILGVTANTVRNWSYQGHFPPPIKIGTKKLPRVRFRRAEVEAYLRQQGVTIAEARHAD